MNYLIEYSKRRSVTILIKDGAVIVKAPIGTHKTAIDKILQKHNKWIEKHLSIDKSKSELYGSLSDEDISKLKCDANVYFNKTCKHYATLMGLAYNKITITSAKRRFGSCSSKRGICFSYLLMLYPEKAREYVVVHELAHLIEMNHSKNFYQIVERFMPDWKERKKLLK